MVLDTDGRDGVGPDNMIIMLLATFVRVQSERPESFLVLFDHPFDRLDHRITDKEFYSGPTALLMRCQRPIVRTPAVKIELPHARAHCSRTCRERHPAPKTSVAMVARYEIEVGGLSLSESAHEEPYHLE
jgi:hypothetical protein